MIGWALRWVLLCCGIVLLGVGLLDRSAALLPHDCLASRTGRPGRHLGPARVCPGLQHDRLYGKRKGPRRPRRRGQRRSGPHARRHRRQPGDAHPGGCPRRRHQSRQTGVQRTCQTANGTARMAPVTLREIRIGQLSIYDVPACGARKSQRFAARHELSQPAAGLRDARRQAHDHLVESPLPPRLRFSGRSAP